jgi:hypothetical protein
MAAEPALLQKIINFLSKRSGMGVANTLSFPLFMPDFEKAKHSLRLGHSPFPNGLGPEIVKRLPDNWDRIRERARGRAALQPIKLRPTREVAFRPGVEIVDSAG